MGVTLELVEQKWHLSYLRRSFKFRNVGKNIQLHFDLANYFKKQYLYAWVNIDDCMRFMGTALYLSELHQKTTPQNTRPISWGPVPFIIPVFRKFCND